MLNICVYNVLVLPLRGRLASLADSSVFASPFGHCNHRQLGSDPTLPLRGRLATLADSSSLASPFGHCNHRQPLFHSFRHQT